MESVKISVIIPFYNVEKYARECLDSVLSQSLGDIEIICVDDGSADGTSPILESCEAKDPRVVLIKQGNSGPSVGRNKGLEIARGEYVSFVDSDDLLAPGAFEKCYRLAREHGADMVQFNADTFFDSDECKAGFQEYREEFQRNMANNNYNRDWIEIPGVLSGPEFFALLYRAGGYRSPIWLNVYSKAMIDRHRFRFLEGLYHADDEFAFKTHLSARSIAYCEDVFYRRRFRPDSIMTTPIGRKNTISRILGLERMRAFYEAHAANLPESILPVVRAYLNERKHWIVEVYLKYLGEGDAEYMRIFESFTDYDTAPAAPGPTPLSRRIKDRIARAIGRA